MNTSTGAIASFETVLDAIAAGFTKALTDEQARELLQLDRMERQRMITVIGSGRTAKVDPGPERHGFGRGHHGRSTHARPLRSYFKRRPKVSR